MNNFRDEFAKTVQAIKSIRMHLSKDEYEIHQAIENACLKSGISIQHEYKLAPRNRIDFLTESGVGIEVKKGKPYSEEVIRQLERYAQYEVVNGIILVIERYQDVPEEINGKPCRSIGLRKLWGIASK